MKSYGCTAASEYLGDRIVYRNLIPVDPHLPGLAEVQRELGLPGDRVPRKTEIEYARVVAWLLKRARERDNPGVAIRRIVFIGDTLRNDVAACDNICQAGDWPGVIFIGAETSYREEVLVSSTPGGLPLYRANRWQLLFEFDRYCASHNLPVDEGAAVLIDLDKTAIGARGRNDHLIDQARLDALRRVIADLHGSDYDSAALEAAYQELCQVEYHPLTEDNQDYLAYVCLLLAGGMFDMAELRGKYQQGALTSFPALITWAEAGRNRLDEQTLALHTEVYASFRQGDPTPFKRFRQQEYRQTIEKMGCLELDTPVEILLASKIALTQEVRALADVWRERGALLFGLSDKPDEASVPSAEMTAAGWLPIHRQPAHAVGA